MCVVEVEVEVEVGRYCSSLSQWHTLLDSKIYEINRIKGVNELNG